MSQPGFVATLLLESSDDEGAPTVSLEDAKKIALDNEPHKHVHFGPFEEENDENQGEAHHNCDCFMINKVTIKNGAAYGIVQIFKYISKSMPDFFPISPHVHNKNIVFFIFDANQAKNIRLLCQSFFKVTVLFGRKYYSNKNIPTDKFLKQIMVKRFNETENSLNLNNLINEKGLPQNLLTSIPGIISLTKLIKRKYPHLNGITLRDNSLENLKCITSLVFICKNLKVLDISHNKLESVAELEVVQFCSKLDTLVLRRNPFSLKCFGLEVYGRHVHRYLPNVKTLDDNNISPKLFYENGIIPLISTPSSNNIRHERPQNKSHVSINVVTID